MDGWFTLECLDDLTPGAVRIISIHNPNIKTQKGLIMKVKREVSHLRVKVY